MCGLNCERYVFTEVPEHEVPTCPAEEREFSVSALQANRVLHDAVWVNTVSQAESVAQLVDGFFFQATYEGGAAQSRFTFRIANESVTGNHGAFTSKLCFAKDEGKNRVEQIDVGNTEDS